VNSAQLSPALPKVAARPSDSGMAAKRDDGNRMRETASPDANKGKRFEADKPAKTSPSGVLHNEVAVDRATPSKGVVPNATSLSNSVPRPPGHPNPTTIRNNVVPPAPSHPVSAPISRNETMPIHKDRNVVQHQSAPAPNIPRPADPGVVAKGNAAHHAPDISPRGSVPNNPQARDNREAQHPKPPQGKPAEDKGHSKEKAKGNQILPDRHDVPEKVGVAPRG
jgi:hypothetical protein